MASALALADERTLVRVANGRTSESDPAMLELLRREQALIFWAIRKYTVTVTERDDALQAARLGFIEAVRRFDPQRGVLLRTFAWRYVLGAVRHEVVSMRRRDVSITELAEDPLFAVDAPTEGINERLDLQPFVAKLTTRQQALVRVMYYGASQAEIARAMDVSPSAVSQQIVTIRHRAREELSTVEYLGRAA